MNDKVAIVHDWLNGMRGGEYALEEFLALYPEADIFTLFLEEENISAAIRRHRIFTSSLNKRAFIRRRYRLFLPFFPQYVESFDLSAYSLVISSSHCVAKGIIPAPQARHVSYIHSPMRYAWDQYYSYFSGAAAWKRALIRGQMSRLRQWDVSSSARVDHFIANSRYVQSRIERYYRRPATVIHPPVDVEHFTPVDSPSRDYFLLVSAFVPYKNIPLVIEACNLGRHRLVIVGRGGEEKRLRRMAGPSVEFRGAVSREELRTLYANARALVFAGVEDFGMVFVESLACGTPVVAYGRGGVCDIVEPGVSGIFFQQQTPQALAAALAEAERFTFSVETLRAASLRFSRARFRQEIARFMTEHGA